MISPRHVAVATLPLLLFSGFSGGSASADPADAAPAEAAAAWAQRRYGAAEAALASTIRKGRLAPSETAAVYARLGAALLMEGRVGRGKEALLRAALVDPHFPLPPRAPADVVRAADAARAEAGRSGRFQIAADIPRSVEGHRPLALECAVTAPMPYVPETIRVAADHPASAVHFERTAPADAKVAFTIPAAIMADPDVLLTISLLDGDGNRISEIVQRVEVVAAAEGAKDPPDDAGLGADSAGSAGAPAPPPDSSAGEEPPTKSKIVELQGTLRNLTAAIHPLQTPEPTRPEGSTLEQLRLIGKVHAGESVTIESHVVQGFGFSTLPAAAADLGPFGPQRYRALNLTSVWASSERAAAALFVDRWSAKIALPWLDVTIGRQAINFSKAYFWSPLDLFLPFGPRTIDREYKSGVDAVRVDVPLGEASGINLVGAAGAPLRYDPAAGSLATPSFADLDAKSSAAIARGFTNVGGFDLSVQGGSVLGGWHAGGGVAGELLTVGVRAEATYFIARDRSALALPAAGGAAPLQVYPFVDHPSFVLGFERRFESSIYLSFEYFYNGAAPGNHDYVTPAIQAALGEAIDLSRHLVGGVVTYDVTPTIVAKLSGVVGASSTASAFIGPSVDWSLTESVDLSGGALVSVGARPDYSGPAPVLRSEFGSYPNVYFVQFKSYF